MRFQINLAEIKACAWKYKQQFASIEKWLKVLAYKTKAKRSYKQSLIESLMNYKLQIKERLLRMRLKSW